MSYIEERAEAYEQETGRKPSEQVIRILEHVDKICAVVEDRGRRHAQEGREALSGDYFRDLVHQAFSGDPDSEFVEEVGSLWQECYMESYQSTPPGINTLGAGMLPPTESIAVPSCLPSAEILRATQSWLLG